MLGGFTAEIMFRTTRNYPGAQQLADACFDAIPPDGLPERDTSGQLAHDLVMGILTEPYRDHIPKIEGGVHGEFVRGYLLKFCQCAVDLMHKRTGEQPKAFLQRMFRGIKSDGGLLVFTDPLSVLDKRLALKDVELAFLPDGADELPPGAIGHLYVHGDGRRQLILAQGVTLKVAEAIQIFRLVMLRLERLDQGLGDEDIDWQVNTETGARRVLLGDISEEMPEWPE